MILIELYLPVKHHIEGRKYAEIEFVYLNILVIVLSKQAEQNKTNFYENSSFIIFRIVVNPDKRPYNMSEVILWTLDDGNTINTLELENDNEECYYFERLERVLATQVFKT